MSENPHAVTAITANALIEKRANILFDIAQAEKRIDALRAQLVHPRPGEDGFPLRRLVPKGA